MESVEISTAEAAQRYAAIGWHVIPTRGKVPIGDGWPARASCDSQAVAAMFFGEHDGVGVVLGPRSGIIDLEADSEAAEAEIVTLFGGEIPVTPTFQSTRGKHRLFRWSDDLPPVLASKAKVMCGQIEVRTGGGSGTAQTVFPPSGERRWIIDPSHTVAELPAVAVAKLAAMASKKDKQPAAVASLPIQFADDGRLDVERWLTSRGSEILLREQTADVTRWFIRCPRIDRHSTSNGIRDCVITQGSGGELGGHCFHASCGMTDWQAIKAAIGAPTSSDYTDSQRLASIDVSGALIEFQETSVADEPNEVIEDDGDDLGGDMVVPFPEECLDPQGTLCQIMDYTLAGSMYQQPELALAGAIALLAAMTGRKISDRYDTRTNLYVLALAKSSTGKEAARKTNKAIPAAAGWLELIGSERIGSHAGIVNALDAYPVSLMQLDEMARLLETAKDAGKSPHLYNVVTVLMQLYSSANTVWKADAYADSKKVKTIDQPHLVIYGTSTPERFWRTLTTDNIGEGLVGRLMIFEGRGYEVSRSSPTRQAVSSELIETVKTWHDFRPGGLLQDCFGSVSIAEHTPEALERYESHLDAIAERRRGESDLRAAVWSRSGEKAAKLALLHACSRARGPAERIELTDVDWGVRLANYLTRRLLAGCSDYVAENHIEAAIKRILTLIPESGISVTNLSKKTRWVRAKERNEIIRDLCDQGSIKAEAVENAGAGRPGIVLRRVAKRRLN